MLCVERISGSRPAEWHHIVISIRESDLPRGIANPRAVPANAALSVDKRSGLNRHCARRKSLHLAADPVICLLATDIEGDAYGALRHHVLPTMPLRAKRAIRART
jgi:hypothetical protein